MKWRSTVAWVKSQTHIRGERFRKRQRIACPLLSTSAKEDAGQWGRRCEYQRNGNRARTKNIARNGETNRAGPSMAYRLIAIPISFIISFTCRIWSARVCVCGAVRHFRFHISHYYDATECRNTYFCLSPKIQYKNATIIAPHPIEYCNFIIFWILCYGSFVTPRFHLVDIFWGPLNASAAMSIIRSTHIFWFRGDFSAPIALGGLPLPRLLIISMTLNYLYLRTIRVYVDLYYSRHWLPTRYFIFVYTFDVSYAICVWTVPSNRFFFFSPKITDSDFSWFCAAYSRTKEKKCHQLYV